MRNMDFVAANPLYEQAARQVFDQHAFMQLIGARLETVRPGYCEIHLPWRPELTQQHMLFHG